MLQALRTQPVAAWLAALGIAIAIGLGAGLAIEPLVALGLLAGAGVAALLVAALGAPKTALVGTIFLLYSYAGWVVLHRFGLPDATPLLLIMVLGTLVLRHLTRGEPLVLHGVGVGLAIAITWGLSAYFAEDQGASVAQLADFAGYALLLVLLVSTLAEARWLRRVHWAIALGAGFLAVLAIVHQATGATGDDFEGFAGINEDTARGGALPRSEGPLQANNFAQMLLVASVFGLYLAARSRGWRRWLAAASFLACVTTVFLTGSRGGLIALLAVWVLVVALRPIPRRLSVGAAVACLILLLAVMPASYFERIGAGAAGVVGGATESEEGAVRGRGAENLAAIYMFADNPLLGVGPANFPVHYLEYAADVGVERRGEARAAHSLYLEALAETGLLGTAAFLAVLVGALVGSWRARGRLRGEASTLAEASFVALAGFLVAGLFLHAAYPRYLWITVAVALTAARMGAPARPGAQPPQPLRDE